MTTFEFLSYLRSLGVRVWAEGDKLRYQALESALLPSLMAELAKRKSDILQVLGELKTNAQPARLSTRQIAEGHQSPLSFSQQGLWFLNRLEPDSPSYTELAPVRMKGRLDVPVLERTLSEIVRRHEALRTIFPAVDGHPTQVIQPACFLKLRIDDLSLLPQDERELEVRQLIKAEAQRPFDLEQGPLMRVRLLRSSLNEHVMVVAMHHIITDGWSMGVLIRELGALYQAFASGKPSPFSELPIQYADYARWQRQWMSGEVLESQLRYWRRQLGGEIPVLNLPTDRPRPAKQSFNGARHAVALGPELSRNLEVMSRERGVTLFMTLLATFQTLLHRYTSQTNVQVGSPVANRTRAETEELIGLFVNTLVLRADLSGDPSFCELLGRVKEMALGAYAHQELPFEKLVEELNPERDLRHTPLFQVMFVLQNVPMPALELGGLELTQIEIGPGTAKFDLELALVETAEGLRGWIEYNTDLFDEASIDRMCGHYRRLLVEVVAKPEERLSNLPLLTEDERRQLLMEWNETKQDYPGSHCLHQLFEAQVAQTPDAVAVIFEQERVTYRELNRRANQLASSLRRLGVGLEGLVALLAERGVDFLSTALAIFKTGAAYIPIDPHYPAQRVCQILSQSRAAFVITATQFGALAAEAANGLVAESRPAIFSLDELLKDLRQEGRLDIHLPPSRLAYVIFTSGSTGAPKGAMVEQCGMLNHMFAKIQALGLNDRDVVAQTASQCFDISVWQFIAVLLVGGTVHIFGDDITHDPASLLDQVELQRVTILEIVPSMMRMMLKESDQRQIKPDLSRLRWLIPTGEALPPDLCRHWLRLYPEIPLLNAYGPTECSDDVTHCPIVEPPAGDTVCVSIGRPIANTQIYVLNTGFHPQPVGVVGELWIAGAGVGRGYLNEATKTAESFAPAPFAIEAGARMYKSGDLACYLPDGNLKYLGRIDHQVKIRGFRIELGEIEAALGRHPAVQDSIVVVREYPPGEERLVAYYVTKPETALSIGELRDFLKQELPGYMAPAAYVKLEALPLTENGKLDRRALPAPDGMWLRLEQGYVAPRTLIEQTLAEIWSQLLGVDRIGVHDEFFELGGHSLLATQVISRVRAAFQVELPLKELFERPTISGLALGLKQMLKAGSGLQAPPLVRTARTGRLPLSFAQQRLWFIEQLKPETSLYNCPGALRFEGRLNLEALERVINEVIRRHEVLRTRMEVSADGEPMQVIDEWEPRRLEVEDLSSLSPEDRQRETRRRAREEAGAGFDLRRGPLLRMKVLRLEEEEHVLLYTMHHIVSDWWSMGILVREVGELYRAYDAGEPSPLEELPIQYADFAVWQREWLSGAVLEQGLDYWRGQLAEAEPLELPTDHPRPAAPSHRGARHHFVIEGAVAEKLRALSQREGVTLFMTLLGGFDVVMSRYGGQEDIVLGTDIANRNHAEVEGLIGFFVNQLAMRVKVKGREIFRELLKRVREVCLGAYAHQDVPFEKLVEELQLKRDLSRAPLFQAKLILQNATREIPELGNAKLSDLSNSAEMANVMMAAKIDLTVAIVEEGRDLAVVTEYDRELFEPATIGRLIGHYGNILKGIVEEEDRAVSELNLLSDEEREQIVVEWNQTAMQYPGEELLHELFAEQARQAPERIAVVSEWEQVSYGELNRRANQVGRYLQSLGVGPEVVVGLCLKRSVEMVAGALGALKAGGSYLPLDVESPLERLGYMLEDAGVGVVLTKRELEARLPAFWGQTVLLDEDWERIGEESDDEPESVVDAENLAYVIYTSGSTGRPKGVMVRHGGLANYLRWAGEAYRISEGAGAPVQSSIGFDLTVTSLYGPLVSGRSVRLAPEAEGIEGLSRALSREGGYSLVKITPAHLGVLAEQLESVEVEGRAGVLVIGGEELKSGALEYWRERARGTRLINEYGPTETVVGCCVYEVKAGERVSEAVPIGRPIANVQMYVLDEELEPAPVGVKGELYVSGAGVARGYLREPCLTAERFIPNQFGREGGGRMYRTGDFGRYVSDGNIEFIGRVDDQVKVRGYRVELAEIEAALNEHTRVRQSVVAAREDERGGKRLVGYVVGQEGVTALELKRHVRERLPEYMVPEAIVVLKEMPLTANGKIDRKRLPLLTDAEREPALECVAPRTMVEELLVGIFEEVLEIDRIGIHENFFDIGGHSLLATRLVSRVRDSFGVEIGVSAIFEQPTAEGLARRIEAAMRSGEKEEWPPLVRAPRREKLPLSFAQQRLWFIDQLEPGNSLYICPGALRFEGRLNLEALESTINEIVRRHEALRTRIEVEEGEPVQVIDEWQPRKLEVKDLRRLGAEEREEEVRRIMGGEAKTGFDLRRGPMIRVKVLKLGEEEHVALFTMHHIVSDAWSMGVLAREVCALYQAFNEGEASPLPELKIQYADYAYWQRQYLRGSALEKHLAYWRKQLGGKLQVLDLPTDYPRPPIPSYRGSTKSFLLPVELSQSLKGLIRREGVTLFMLLLAAFKTLLYKYTAQEDIIIGTSAENRNRTEIEPLIGFFVNTLPMRTSLSGNPTFRELLKRVKEVALGGYAHQDLPFEKLVEEIRPERAVRQMPLFNVVFGVQNAPREDLRLQGLEIKPMVAELEGARFDLTIWITEGREQIQASWIYSKDLFKADTVVHMHDHFEFLLSGIVDRPDARLTNLDISPEMRIGPNPQGPGGREDLDIEEPLPIKRRGINLITKPV